MRIGECCGGQTVSPEVAHICLGEPCPVVAPKLDVEAVRNLLDQRCHRDEAVSEIAEEGPAEPGSPSLGNGSLELGRPWQGGLSERI